MQARGVLCLATIALGALAQVPQARADEALCPAPLLMHEGQCVTYEESVTLEAGELVAPELEVTIKARRFVDHRQPGATEVTVSIPEDWTGSVTWTQGARHEPPRTIATEPIGRPEATRTLPWSCRSPGRVVHYTVTAQGPNHAPLSRSGSFREGSRKWCAQVVRLEEAGRRNYEAEVRAHEEAERTSARNERERIEGEISHYEHNCKAIGGSPVWLDTSEGRRLYCHSQSGGLLPVPH